MSNELSVVVDGGKSLSIEIREQRGIALSSPRQEDQSCERAMAELAKDPEFAKEAYYILPFGKDEDGKPIQGLGVVASRALVRHWRNLQVASRIVNETEAYYEVQGACMDLESNATFYSSGVVFKTYTPRGSSVPVLMNQFMLKNAIKAELSKVERNAAMNAIPEWLKGRYFKAAKALAATGALPGQKPPADGKPIIQRLDEMYSAFAKLGVDRKRVDDYVGGHFDKDVKPDELLGTMLGVYNAIKGGHAKIEDIFTAAGTGPKATAGPVNVEDLMGAKAAPPAAVAPTAATTPPSAPKAKAEVVASPPKGKVHDAEEL